MMDKLSTLIKKKSFDDPHRNVSREFQAYGFRLAETLDDLEHKALYIRLAKEVPRGILERARSYALDYPNAKSKAKIFMLKLKDLRNEVGVKRP